MIRLVADTIDKHDVDRLIEWLKTYPRLTKGPVTEEYEAKWAEYIGTKYAVMVNSGSSANLILLAALLEGDYIRPGSNVIVPALSWSTDLAPVMQLGLNPILCDCNKSNLSLDLETLETLITQYSPSVVMLVSILGLVPNMDAVRRICERRGVILIEDACESLGSTYKDKKLGSMGFASTFSTYFGHHISTIEGGMVCTNDNFLYNVLKSVRSHGWGRDMDVEHRTHYKHRFNIDDFNDMYTFYFTGMNLRSTDLQAYIGLGQLEKLPHIVDRRSQNFYEYKNGLKDTWKPLPNQYDFVSNFAYPVIDERRDKIVEALKDICETRPLISGHMGAQPFYARKYGYDVFRHGRASEARKYGMYLPNHPDLKTEEIELICNTINSVE